MGDTYRMSAKHILIIIAVAILSGCQGMMPRPKADLSHYQYDCSHKAEQVAYLQSLRRSQYEEQVAKLKNEGETDGYTWEIDYHLLQLNKICQ